MNMGLNRALLYLIGCFVIGLNILQVNCAAPTTIDLERYESCGSELGEPSSDDIQKFLEILKVARTILDKNKMLLLEKNEIKELLGEELEILKKFKELDSELRLFAGGEIAIRYHLMQYPDHAPLLDSAVEIWRKIISDSFIAVDKTSKEIYNSFIDAESVAHSDVSTEIAKEVADTKAPKMLPPEYNEFVKAVFIKLGTLYELPFHSKLERQLFKKISTFYKQGLFDDICKSLGDDALYFIFQLSSKRLE